MVMINKDLVLWTQRTGADAGASASSDDSSPNQPSGSGELSKVDQTPDSTKKPHWPFQEHLLPHRSKHILDSDERLIQKAIEKVTEAFEGEQANQVISEIKALLTHVLNSIRMFLESYEGRISRPFYLFTPVGSNSHSLFEEMVCINQHQRDLVIKLLGITNKAISRIIKKPRKVANRLRDIVYKAQLLRNYISFHYHTYYTTLFSKMDTTENRAYVEVTKDYIRQMDSDWDLALELLEKIKGMVNDGMMRLKPVPSRFSSLMLNVKKRLGIKDGPPTDTTTD
ncbi:hypothetical protein BASA61_000652 [Batrachochytrium salamandrivorans]|nr:hypothetical protein BASA61_000652 [Batrachochytrium salamandrivorans]